MTAHVDSVGHMTIYIILPLVTLGLTAAPEEFPPYSFGKRRLGVDADVPQGRRSRMMRAFDKRRTSPSSHSDIPNDLDCP